MFLIGSGTIWVKPLYDPTGVAYTNPTTILLGGNALQEFDINDTLSSAELYGNLKYPLEVIQTKGKLEIGAKIGSINLNAMNSIQRNQTVTSGLDAIYWDTTAGTVIPTTPYTITITPPSSGVFAESLSVINATTLRPMSRVASSPTTGQYSVNESTGVYTFASADAGQYVKISYRYTATSTVAQTCTVLNTPIGLTTYFQLYLLQTSATGGIWTRKYPKAMCSDFKRTSKQDGYAISDLKFMAMDDGSGKLMYENFSDSII
jgi:hypothetical protein